jgi:branched-chain amino acid transport system ATP-binding protein
MTPIISGEIIFNGTDILALPLERLHALGMGYFMQGAPVFPQMTVKENLRVAAGRHSLKEFSLRLEEMKGLFPILDDASFDQMPAGSLSGGERTQLCIAMSIFRKPSLLVLDEPFAGLSPSNAALILKILNGYQEAMGATILLIAQDRYMAKGFSTDQYIIRDGKINKDTL